MYIRNYGEYYSDQTKMELIVDKEALELIERTLWAEIVEEANSGGKHLHDQLTKCRLQVMDAIEKCMEREASKKEQEDQTDAQE